MSDRGDFYGPAGSDAPGRVRTPAEPGAESAGPPLTDFVVELRRNAEALRTLYARLSRRWDLYRETAAAATDGSGDATISLPRLIDGWEAAIERLTISVGGASAAATVSVYRNGVQESVLLDFTNGLLGNSPSRQIAEYNPPIRLRGNEGLVVVVDAAVATQQVYVRCEGRKREL